MNGLKKSAEIGESNGLPRLPIVPIPARLKGNVGSLHDPRTVNLFTFGPRG